MVMDKLKTYALVGMAGLIVIGGSGWVASAALANNNRIKTEAALQKKLAEEKKRADAEKARADGEARTRARLTEANKALLEQQSALSTADRATDVRYVERTRTIEKVVRERDLTTANWLIANINTTFYDADAPVVVAPAKQ